MKGQDVVDVASVSGRHCLRALDPVVACRPRGVDQRAGGASR